MHQQKSKKILIYFFLFLIIGTINNKNLNNFHFPNVKQISIIGLDEKNNFKLINELSFLKTNNLFFVDKKKISEIIDSNTLVEQYSVFKKYPSTLDISINKTVFLAQIKKDGKSFFLGSNGKLTKSLDKKKDLPFIFGDFKVENFFELKDAIDKTSFNFYDIKTLFFFKSGRWDLETNTGLLIKLPKKEIKKSIEMFVDFLRKNNDKEINKIDLRQLNQIIING